MKADVKRLRQGLFLMRKNVLPQSKRANSSSRRISKTRKTTLEEEQEDRAEDFYQSPSFKREQEGEPKQDTQSTLTLPEITRSTTGHKRATSAKAMLIRDEPSETTTESVTDFTDQKND